MKITQKYKKEDFDKLNKIEFHQLWWNDALTERQIAKLYGVTKKEVHKKRKELGLGIINSAMMLGFG